MSRLYGLNVGVKEQAFHKLTIHPNPVSTRLTVELEERHAHGTLVLLDALGREVMRSVARVNTILDISGLGEGVYVLSLRTPDDRTMSAGVVVQH